MTIHISKDQIKKILHKKQGQIIFVSVSLLAIAAVTIAAQYGTFFLNKASSPAGTTFLTFLPSSGSFPLQKTSVDLVATIGNEQIDGIQAVFTVSNSSNFSDVSFQTNNTTGLQLVTNSKTISGANTQFKVSFVTQVPNTPFTSGTNVTLGHLVFTPTLAGSSTVSFDTLLSKIVRHGTVEEILNTPQNVTYQFTSVTPTPTSTPAPTPAPTSTPTPTASATPNSASSIYPIEDTYVDSSAASISHTSDSALYVDGSPNKVAYLLFDLTSLNAANLTNPQLSFKTTSGSYSGAPDKVQIYLVNDTSWPENIAFSNSPQISSTKLGEILATNSNTIYNVALDPAVLKSHAGGRLALAVVATGGDAMYFYSRESSIYKPQIVISTSTSTGSKISIFAAGTSANGIYPNMSFCIIPNLI